MSIRLSQELVCLLKKENKKNSKIFARMKDLVDELGFVDMEYIFDYYKIRTKDLGIENIYVKYRNLPDITSFDNHLSLNQLIDRAVSLLLKPRNSRNTLSAGYSKSSNGINLTGVSTHSKHPNTTASFFKFKYWSDILKSLGDDLALFLLSECFIIDRRFGKNVLLAGNVWLLSEIHNKPKYEILSRKVLFTKQGNFKKLEYENLIKTLIGTSVVNHEWYSKPPVVVGDDFVCSVLNTRGIHHFIRKVNSLNIHGVFLDLFKTENVHLQNSTILENEVNQGKIVQFLFCIAKKTLNTCISFYNFRVLNSKLLALIKRNKFEDISYPELAKYFKVDDTKLFLSPNNKISQKDYICRSIVLTRFVAYLFEKMFLPIISQYFYVTEANFTKLKVFYFVRKIWNSFSIEAVAEFLGNFEQIKEQEMFNRIRAIPKKKDFRVITNCNNSNDIRLASYLLKSEFEGRLGNSILGYRDVIDKLNSYRGEANGHNYMLKIDLKRCFDKIPHGKLREIINTLFLKPSYRVKKYYLLEKIAGKSRVKLVRLDGEKRLSLHDLVISEKVKHNQIICDNVFDDDRTRTYMLNIVEQAIFENVIKYRKNYYRQIKGIPQGSIISPLICSLYLSMIDKQYLDHVMSKGFFRRYIDDFLIVSPDIWEIVKIVAEITKLGYLGLEINESKIEGNFYSHELSHLGFELACINDKYIEWCGIKIYSDSLGVKCNFGIENMGYSCVFNGTPGGKNLFGKLQRDFQRRMNPIFISKSNMCKFMNLYDTFYLLSRKIMVLAKRMDYINTVLISSICSDFVFYASRILRRRGIFLERNKIEIIAAKAYINSGLDEFLRKYKK